MEGYVRSARLEWEKLDGLRQAMLNRLERLAQLTVPSVLAEEYYNTDTDQLTNGFTSLGAEGATHLTNKLMLALFAPSRPFMRLELERKVKEQLIANLGVTEDELTSVLVAGEQDAMEQLEQAGERSVLFEILLHLVCLGNVLMDLSGDGINLIGIRDYVVRRNAKGKVMTLVLREKYCFYELDEQAQKEYQAKIGNAKYDDKVCLYTWVRWTEKGYRSSVWVEDCELSDSYKGKWTEDTMPWHPLTWRLPARQHYGVGRAEDYANDLAEHESLSRALSDGSALASTFRWLANPGGQTRPEDVTNAVNGAVVPGVANDLSLVFANIGNQLNTVLQIRQDVARRIGTGFLMNSAVTRDAERVTAAEIRVQALELEGTLGGNYSRLGVDMQKPISHWMLKKAQIKLQGTQIKPIIITGLEALSRSSDRDRMLTFLGDVAALDNIQPNTRARLREDNIVADMAAGAGVDRSRYVATQAEFQQRQAATEQQQLNQQAEAAAIEAAATTATQEPV